MRQYLFALLFAIVLTGCVQGPETPIIEELSSPSVHQEEEIPQESIEEKPTQEQMRLEEEKKYTTRFVPDFYTREQIVQNAMSYKGKRDGGDCSGFVNLVNNKNNYAFYSPKELDKNYDNARKSRAMYNLMRKKNRTYSDELPYIGDLIFFEDTERRKSKGSGNVAENITHVGIVTRVDADGTVEFIHHSRGRNKLDYMNLKYPTLTKKDGKTINTYMKRCSSKKGQIVRTDCLNHAFFVAYGTF